MDYTIIRSYGYFNKKPLLKTTVGWVQGQVASVIRLVNFMKTLKCQDPAG